MTMANRTSSMAPESSQRVRLSRCADPTRSVLVKDTGAKQPIDPLWSWNRSEQERP